MYRLTYVHVVSSFAAYFIFRDRGMGIVSLDCYLHPGYRVKVVKRLLYGTV